MARYRLGYPNQEVRQSLNESLLGALAPNASAQLSSGARFRELLGTNDRPPSDMAIITISRHV